MTTPGRTQGRGTSVRRRSTAVRPTDRGCRSWGRWTSYSYRRRHDEHGNARFSRPRGGSCTQAAARTVRDARIPGPLCWTHSADTARAVAVHDHDRAGQVPFVVVAPT